MGKHFVQITKRNYIFYTSGNYTIWITFHRNVLVRNLIRSLYIYITKQIFDGIKNNYRKNNQLRPVELLDFIL